MNKEACTLTTERWITRVVSGRVELVQRIPEDAFVVVPSELPMISANRHYVSDDLAAEIVGAIKGR
jgi:hypothetical protein